MFLTKRWAISFPLPPVTLGTMDPDSRDSLQDLPLAPQALWSVNSSLLRPVCPHSFQWCTAPLPPATSSVCGRILATQAMACLPRHLGPPAATLAPASTGVLRATCGVRVGTMTRRVWWVPCTAFSLKICWVSNPCSKQLSLSLLRTKESLLHLSNFTFVFSFVIFLLVDWLSSAF